MDAFELFFNSMRNRDTLTLKTCIHFSQPANWFFKQFSGNDQQLTGNSASTAIGFVKSVSYSNGNTGKCQNEFDSIDIKIGQRYAIVTAHYQCFVEGNSHHKGIYTVQMLKSDKWRIESLTSYAEKVD